MLLLWRGHLLLAFFKGLSELFRGGKDLSYGFTFGTLVELWTPGVLGLDKALQLFFVILMSEENLISG